MGRKFETFTSFIWACVAGTVIALLSTAYYHYHQNSGASTKLAEAQQTISSLEQEVGELLQRNDVLSVALKYSSTDHLLARIWIEDQFVDPGSGKTITVLTFVEVNEEGAQIGIPQKFQIVGTSLYLEGKVVKFEDDFIHSGDAVRGTSLMKFWRVFGDTQEPAEGSLIQDPTTRPSTYERGGVESEFEQKLWADFLIAIRDPQKAKEIGARNLQFEAPSLPVQKGDILEAKIRSSGGIELKIIATKSPDTETL